MTQWTPQGHSSRTKDTLRHAQLFVTPVQHRQRVNLTSFACRAQGRRRPISEAICGCQGLNMGTSCSVLRRNSKLTAFQIRSTKRMLHRQASFAVGDLSRAETEQLRAVEHVRKRSRGLCLDPLQARLHPPQRWEQRQSHSRSRLSELLKLRICRTFAPRPPYHSAGPKQRLIPRR